MMSKKTLVLARRFVCVLLLSCICASGGGNAYAQAPFTNYYGLMRLCFQMLDSNDMEGLKGIKEQMIEVGFTQDILHSEYADYVDQWEYLEEYLHAWDELQAGRYESAESSFIRLSIKQVSFEHIETSLQNRCAQLTLYCEAMSYAQLGNALWALIALEKIDANALPAAISSQVALSLLDTKEVLYRQAQSLYDNSDWAGALPLFEALVGFLRSDYYVAQCNIKLDEETTLYAPTVLHSSVSSIELSWENNPQNMTYLLAYAPVGIAQEISYLTIQGNQVVLTDLLPATTYNIMLQLVETNETSPVLEAMTGTPRTYDAYRSYTSYEATIDFFAADRENVRRYGYDEVVGSNMLTNIPGDALPTPSFRIQDSEQGFVIIVSRMFDFTTVAEGELAELKYTCILRMNNGQDGTYWLQSAKNVESFAGKVRYVSIHFPLDEMLDQYYGEKGQWASDHDVIEIYIGDELLCRKTFTLQ